MKRYKLYLFICFLFPNICFSFNGEFMIYKTPGSPLSDNLNLHLMSTGGVWLWNNINNTVYQAQSYDKTFEDIGFGFDVPKRVDVADNGVMPWAIMQFALSGGSNSITFTIDFRDERWSSEYDKPDIILYFDTQTGTAYLQSPKEDENNVPITDNCIIYIWDAYHQSGDPVIINFSSPVFLKNTITLNNTNVNAGGTLNINSNTYNSGESAWVTYGFEYPVGTNNERFSNFQNLGTTYKHNNWNRISDDYLLSR